MHTPENFSFKQAVYDRLKKRLPNNPKTGEFRVIKSHPHDNNLLPCLSVTQAGGGLGTQTIGEEHGTVKLDGEWFGVEGTMYRETLHITVWTYHPDHRDDLAVATRFALWRILKELSDEFGIAETSMSEDGDGNTADDDQNAPQELYLFNFTLTALVPLEEMTPLGPPTDVVYTVAFGDGE
jgi:hypothetical protein